MQHWQHFLEAAQGPDIWMVNHFISSPAGDGGQQHIPTLKVPQADGMTSEVTTNEEKATTFHQSFFPPKPAVTEVPDEPEYLVWVKYKFRGAAPLANFTTAAIQSTRRGQNPECGLKTGGQTTNTLSDPNILCSL